MKYYRTNLDNPNMKPGCNTMPMMSLNKPDPAPCDPEQLMTIRQVAQLMQYSVQTIRNRLDSGSFLPPTHRDGRMIRWRRADLLEYLRGLRTE